jgi:hypothetical protein
MAYNNFYDLNMFSCIYLSLAKIGIIVLITKYMSSTGIARAKAKIGMIHPVEY